jgi:hypothetical protein
MEQLINNIEQYYLDLSADGTGEDGGPLLWSPGFFPRHALALTDFSAQGWQGVLNRMWENETFAKAYQVRLVGSDATSRWRLWGVLRMFRAECED